MDMPNTKKVYTTKFINNNIEIEKVSNCHQLSFPQSFSTKLGIRYLNKMFKWYTISDNRFLIGVFHKDKIIGYAGGAVGHGSSSAIFQYSFYHALFSIVTKPHLLLNKKLLERLSFIRSNLKRRIKNLLIKKDITSMKLNLMNLDLSVGLIVIGVDPNYRRKGIGKILSNEFQKSSKSLGANRCHLTVKASNIAAIKAYKTYGWFVSKYQGSEIKMTFIIR